MRHGAGGYPRGGLGDPRPAPESPESPPCPPPQIDDSLASLVIAQLLFLQSESNKKPIHMYINSPGEAGHPARATYSPGGGLGIRGLLWLSGVSRVV